MNNILIKLAKVQNDLPAIIKDKTAKVKYKSGGGYEHDYASLEAIMPILKPLLMKHNLGLYQTVKSQNLETILFDLEVPDVQQIVSVYPLQLENKNPNEIASQQTYARRYSIVALFNIVPVDDDANIATGNDFEISKKNQEAKQAPVQIEIGFKKNDPKETKSLIEDLSKKHPGKPIMNVAFDFKIAPNGKGPGKIFSKSITNKPIEEVKASEVYFPHLKEHFDYWNKVEKKDKFLKEYLSNLDKYIKSQLKNEDLVSELKGFNDPDDPGPSFDQSEELPF